MKVIKAYIVFVTVVLLACVTYGTCGVVTRPSEYILIRQFGAIKEVKDEPGLSFKLPFVQSTQSIPKYKMCYDLAPSSINTSDKKIMIVDSFALWSISDPLTYVKTIGGSVSAAEGRLNNTVYNSINTVMPSMTQDAIIDGRDGSLANVITSNIGSGLDGYGIKLYKVETKMLDLPEANKTIVFERMISERNSIAASYEAQGQAQATKIKNETDKTIELSLSEANATAEKLRAEGEAEYMNILSAAYSDESKADFYEFIRGLDTLKVTIKGNNKTLILDKDSEIARLLIGN